MHDALPPFLSSLAAPSADIRPIGGGVFSALPQDAAAAHYDRRAAPYDAIVGLSVYHRVAWGTARRSYLEFAASARAAAGRGGFVEAGCGSLLFTAPLYGDAARPPVLLVDRSEPMLRRAAARLRSHGGAAAHAELLHADIASLPVRAACLSSVLSLNVLHVPCDVDAISREFARILVPGSGRLFVSALVRSGRWSDRYMSFLHRIGELGPPMTVETLHARVVGQWGVIESSRLEGNMCFCVVRHE